MGWGWRIKMRVEQNTKQTTIDVCTNASYTHQLYNILLYTLKC